MDRLFFHRVAESLRGQQQRLLAWLREAPPSEKALRLGELPDDALQEHVRVLEGAIEKAESGELGRCTICHEHVEEHRLETNYSTSVCIDHLTGEERSRLENELELSQKVQRALLPQAVPDIPGWEMAAFSQPASIVGGDYFDFLKFRDGAHAFIIADVMGKGMPASLLMASLQASLRIILPEGDSPEEVLDRVNRLFCHNIHLTKFVTIVVLHLDPLTGQVRYANAGHNPPLLMKHGTTDGGGPLALRPTGAAIGLVENSVFRREQTELHPGDTLLLYTDGVVEAAGENRQEFGEERLRAFSQGHFRLAPVEFLRRLRSEIRSFTHDHPLTDDTTVIVCRRTGTSG